MSVPIHTYLHKLALPAAALVLLGACAQSDPEVVGDDCGEDGCAKTTAQLTRIETVDVLLVVDSSTSITPKTELLKAELPRMMNAMLSGEDGDTSFPPAKSVHVAVTTSDLGSGYDMTPQCQGLGDDGLFLAPGEAGITCDDVSYPGYLAYDGGPAALATADSVSCLPLVGTMGCGFEQHLEAGLKALWPSDDDSLTFEEGTGHGDEANAGFLRDDSLLVIVVVTDEDDCSATDWNIFRSPTRLNADDPVREIDFNLRCWELTDRLHDVQRYVDGFRGLRPNNDNVIFAVVGGIPPELVSDETVGEYDLSTTDGAADYFDHVLSAKKMQYARDESLPQGSRAPLPSCGDEMNGLAYPPIRLVETAAAFGPQGVLGSLCADDFGATIGRIIRTVGQRLTEAANAAADDSGDDA